MRRKNCRQLYVRVLFSDDFRAAPRREGTGRRGLGRFHPRAHLGWRLFPGEETT